jgi:hypothetical protein
VRDLKRIDIPQSGKLGDMRFVLPVAEAGEIAVAARLTRVLSGRLPVHLQHAAARPPEHATQQVHVVHLTRRGRRLVALIDALQDKRRQALALAENPSGSAELARVYAGDLGHSLRRVARDRPLQGLQPDRVRLDPGPIDMVVLEELLDESVEDGHVRAGLECEMHVGLPRSRRAARVDDHEQRSVGAR